MVSLCHANSFTSISFTSQPMTIYGLRLSSGVVLSKGPLCWFNRFPMKLLGARKKRISNNNYGDATINFVSRCEGTSLLLAGSVIVALHFHYTYDLTIRVELKTGNL